MFNHLLKINETIVNKYRYDFNEEISIPHLYEYYNTFRPIEPVEIYAKTRINEHCDTDDRDIMNEFFDKEEFDTDQISEVSIIHDFVDVGIFIGAKGKILYLYILLIFLIMII